MIESLSKMVHLSYVGYLTAKDHWKNFDIGKTEKK